MSMDPSAQIVALLPRLRRYARSLTRHAADADDLVQTAMERALARKDQWRADASLAGWLFGIVKNAWIDELRSAGRRRRLFAPEEDGEHAGRASADSDIDRWSVEQAMATLPPEQRLAIALVLIEGLSYAEAASVLEVPVGTLTSRLARGRAALAAQLRDAPAVAPEVRDERR
jgi:RNA polymerase sigma-70 factor (ECF subfamily)